MSGLSRKNAARKQKKTIHKSYFVGTSENTKDLKNALSEDERRRDSGGTTVINNAAPSGGGGGGGIAVKGDKGDPGKDGKDGTNGSLGPDRWHKWDNNRVCIAKDHRTGEDSPVNPGYALPNIASSIVTGYQKCLELSMKLLDNSRVTLCIHGGEWDEPVQIMHEKIDVEGYQNPIVRGDSYIGPTSRCSIKGVEFYNKGGAPGTSPGLWILGGPEVGNQRSSIQIERCRMRGKYVGFRSMRRIYMNDCFIWCEQEALTDKEYASAIFERSSSDTAWSEVVDTQIYGYTANLGLTGHTEKGVFSSGWAVKATDKIMPPGIYNGYYIDPLQVHQDAYGILVASDQKSGVKFDNCSINGSLLCEGWRVEHLGGSQQGGLPHPTKRGGIYAHIRGYWAFNADGAWAIIPGEVWFDHTKCRSGAVAKFIHDPSQPDAAYHWSGNLYFRHSQHVCRVTDAVGGSSCLSDGTFGRSESVRSSTYTTGWSALGVADAKVDCSTSVPIQMMVDGFMA